MSLHRHTQTNQGPHCTVSNGYGLLFPSTLCSLYKAGHLPASGAMVDNVCSFASTHCTHLHGAQLRHNDNFTVCLKYQALKICGVYIKTNTNKSTVFMKRHFHTILHRTTQHVLMSIHHLQGYIFTIAFTRSNVAP
jgi:hypothetical protein